MGFGAVIFDMDGVLVDSEPYHIEAYQRVLAKFGINFQKSDYKRILGKTALEIFTELFQRNGVQENPQEWAERKEATYREVIEKQLQPTKELIPLLDELLVNRTKLGVATSAPRKNLEAVLRCTKLERYFQSTLGLEDITHPKPNPEIYLKSATRLGIPISQCAVIEDSVIGLESARAAGVFAIGITTSFPAGLLTPANIIFDSFSQICSFLIGKN